jgi:hypothetical protein
MTFDVEWLSKSAIVFCNKKGIEYMVILENVCLLLILIITGSVFPTLVIMGDILTDYN